MGITTNEESMESKKRVANIIDNTNIIGEIEVELEKTQGKWTSLKEKRHQARTEHFLDFRNAVIPGGEERDAKTQKQIIKRVNKEKQRHMELRCLTNNMGRGRNNALKQLQVIDENTNSVKRTMIGKKWKKEE